MIWYKKFGFVKKIFVSAMMTFSSHVLNVNSLECVWMKNQEFKVGPEIKILTVMNLHFILTALE